MAAAAASAASREDNLRSSMDLDGEAYANSSAPAQPTTNSTPDTNGVDDAEQNNDNEEKSPTPPPHGVQPVVDAESFKLAGNKFFKAGDYSRAILEYTKGNHFCSVSPPLDNRVLAIDV